jgi:GT2 family glycosyltransferase
MTRILYHIPLGVELASSKERPMVSTQSGGRIVFDQRLMTLWKYANGRSLEQIISHFRKQNFDPTRVRAGLACLAEAGLLEREDGASSIEDHQLVQGSLVSIIVVGFNSRDWLENCLPSLDSQDYAPLETILVDNGSTDGTTQWVENNFPEVRLLRLEKSQSLAFAINTGIQEAKGEFFLLLNPDVQLEQSAIKWLVKVAKDDPTCAAIATKLKFLFVPAFLNGIGNYVGGFSFGTDSALGHLDLGQFDSWSEVPSACFAATLIPAKVWEEIGPLDENFPLYYEDSEWCYRARLYGYIIKVSPQSLAYHAVGGRTSDAEIAGLASRKLRCVVYGRLRFATLILGFGYMLRFLFSYLFEDCFRILFSLVRGHWESARSYPKAWGEYLRSLPELRRERETVQARRIISDKELFETQKKVPVPLVWRGLPQLTWDIVQYHYFSYLVSDKTREIQEFSGFEDGKPYTFGKKQKTWSLGRAVGILKDEGFNALLHRMGRDIQWFLMKL